jgi:hypothetical protein
LKLANSGAGAKRIGRRQRVHANFLQEPPIAILSFFKGFDGKQSDLPDAA